MAEISPQEAGRKGGEKVRTLIEAGKSEAAGDPTLMLKSDHDRVKQLFREFEHTTGQRLASARQACLELQVHTRLEEELFYPAARKRASGRLLELLDDALEEHEEAKFVIDRLLTKQSVDSSFEDQFSSLQQIILHHVEEEENEMFELAKQAIGGQADELQRQMKVRKKELESLIH